MNPRRTAAPAAEPISLAEAKAHLRIDHGEDDSLITALIIAAREAAESHTGLSFISQEWTMALDSWQEVEHHARSADSGGDEVPSIAASGLSGGGSYIRLPRGPLLSLTAIRTYDAADVVSTWGAGNSYVAVGEDRIYRRAGISWPVPGRKERGIEIVYVAGFGSDAGDVPAAIRHGLLMLVAHYYAHRDGDMAAEAAQMPFGVRALLAPWCVRRV